jgi:hypothetical protein
LTARHYREIEQTIVDILSLPEERPSHRLRVVMTGGVAYVDGHVPEYRQKKAITQLMARIARPRRVINRVRVVPGQP